MNRKKIFNKIGRNGKTIIDNFISLVLLQVAGYVLPFITLPYLSKVIGVEKFGEIAFASAIMIYFQTLVDYGFIFSAVRDISRCRDDKEKASVIFSNVMWARFLLVFVSLIILIILIFCVAKFYEMKLLLIASFFIVIGHALFPDWMFQAIEKMHYITIFNLFIKVLFTILVFVMIKEQADYFYQPILTSLGFCISGVISLIVLKRMGFQLKRPEWKSSLLLIKSNTDLFINQIVPNLYNSLSSIVLGFTSGSAANGMFDAGNRFNNIASQFIAIISRVFFPYLSRKLEKHKLYLMIHLGISLFIAIVLYVCAPLIIDIFFTDEFLPAAKVLRIMSVSLIFLSLTGIYGNNYLILIGKEKDLRNSTVLASILGCAIMIPLVYYYSYIGAALTIVISRGLLAFTITLKAIRIQKKIHLYE